MKQLINNLRKTHNASDKGLKILIETPESEYLFRNAEKIRRKHHGTDVILNGVIEFTNYCCNSCYYCDRRAENRELCRIRLTPDEVLSCADEGVRLGCTSFTLCGGEDMKYSDSDICNIIHRIKNAHPDCTITLSVGERKWKSYNAYKDAGADGYLLRHEAINPRLYGKLHPGIMSIENKKRCLWDLKELGYKTGTGFMVGCPHQTTDDIILDLRFMQDFFPDFAVIEPFMPVAQTPFSICERGSIRQTLNITAILRLMFPEIYIHDADKLSAFHERGCELGIKAGANTISIDLSPENTHKMHSMYSSNIYSESTAYKQSEDIKRRIQSIGFQLIGSNQDMSDEQIEYDFNLLNQYTR